MGLSSGQYTNLFEVIGEYVQRVNDFVAIITALETDRSQIQAEMEANSVPLNHYRDNTDTFEGFKNAVVGWIGNLTSKVTQLLNDDDFVLDNFVTTSGWEGIILELVRDMQATTQHIDINAVTIGSVSASVTNANSATVLTGAYLDGFNVPVSGGMSNVYLAGVLSELAPTADTMNITATDDSTETSITEGNETFVWGGGDGEDGYTAGDVGTGQGPTMRPLTNHSSDYGLSNLDFETWTDTTTPGTWTDSDHPPTRNTDEYKGTYALGLVGTGSATFDLTQAVTTARLDRYRRYCFACYVKGQAGIGAGVLTIKFTGTGYTASSSEKIEMNAAALAAQTSYGIEYFFINMPAEIPTDLKLSITLTPALTNAKIVLIDHMQFGPVDYHGGVHASIVDGSGQTTKNDRYTFTVANNDNGVFQTFFRKGMKIQLPSNASPSIADSLASD